MQFVETFKWALVSVGGGLASFLAEWTATGVAASITGIGLAAVGVYKMAASARREAAEAWHASNAGQFQAQLASLAERVEDANQKLHALRNEANARELAHQEEVERLQEQLKLALDQLRTATAELQAARTDNARLAGEVESMRRQLGTKIDKTTAAVAAVHEEVQRAQS